MLYNLRILLPEVLKFSVSGSMELVQVWVTVKTDIYIDGLWWLGMVSSVNVDSVYNAVYT